MVDLVAEPVGLALQDLDPGLYALGHTALVHRPELWKAIHCSRQRHRVDMAGVRLQWLTRGRQDGGESACPLRSLLSSIMRIRTRTRWRRKNTVPQC